MPLEHKNGANNGKKRRNVMFSEQSESRGKKLAKEDKRSFSGMMESLIDAEWLRRTGKAKAA